MTSLLSPVDVPGQETADALATPRRTPRRSFVPGNGAQAAEFNYYATGAPAY